MLPPNSWQHPALSYRHSWHLHARPHAQIDINGSELLRHPFFCCQQQLGLRTLSVGLANNLLLNLPEPFKRSTFAAAAASAPGHAAPAQPEGELDAITATPAPTRAAQDSSKGPNVPAGMTVAPWSVVALATLLHRCELMPTQRGLAAT